MNPLQNPNLYDYIRLDGIRSPGICERVSGGDRETKIDVQQSPGYDGAFIVTRGDEVATIDYQFVLWRLKDFADDKTYHAMLRAGMKTTPKRVYTLDDPFLDGQDIRRVVVHKIGKLEQLETGKYGRKVSFIEARQRKLNAGLVQPDTKVDPQIAAQQKATEAAKSKFGSTVAAMRAEKIARGK